MPLKRCIPCYGSGKIMGGGTILQDCEYCDGRGKVEKPEDDIDYLLKQQSEKHILDTKESAKETDKNPIDVRNIKSIKRGNKDDGKIN